MQNSYFQTNITTFKNWLKESVFPVWTQQGIEHSSGGFYETLDFDGQIVKGPRRCLVQSRQIYSYLTGARMNVVSQETADRTILAGARYMIEKYQQEDGSFIFSITHEGQPYGTHKPLYTQAFAIFGLAQAYSISSQKEFKDSALRCLKYLRDHRRTKAFGFTEVDDKNNVTYASNPHMHLFEAVLAWSAIDHEVCWKELANEIASLALTKFICKETKMLGEYFDQDWNHLRIENRFIYEPGHQFEWAWLFKVYDEIFEANTFETRHLLFQNAEKYGVSKEKGLAYDEMWSDHSIKSASARFWPQGERVKAACRLGIEAPTSIKENYAQAADQALTGLNRYLQTPKAGFWYDQLSADDNFIGNTAKASSLYHIINAMEEYENFRSRIS